MNEYEIVGVDGLIQSLVNAHSYVSKLVANKDPKATQADADVIYGKLMETVSNVKITFP